MVYDVLMKIVSWNCNGAFRNKFETLLPLKADVWVIQECESPEFLEKHGISIPAHNFLWHGTRDFKGLGIFTFHEVKAQTAPFFNPDYRYILPAYISSSQHKPFLLNGVWACLVPENRDWDYIGQMCHFAAENRDHFDENSLTLGDFNINMLWNNAFKKEHNYERFLEIMSSCKQESLYHKLYNCPQGEEKIPTSYYRRNPERPFHIDYVFGGENVFTHLKKFKIHGKEWLTHSDHLPLELEILL